MRIETLRDEIDDLLHQLGTHPLYEALHSSAHVHTFMESHVFCVWDFMTLLMALRRELCGDGLLWIPSGHPDERRLINEIVLDEESDHGPDGRVLSHFELYLEAMRQAGADRTCIDQFLERLRAGEPLKRVTGACPLPPGVGAFVDQTLELAHGGSLHVVSAVFFSSREAIIPPIFRRVLEGIAPDGREERRYVDEADPDHRSWELFRFYLNRHIEIDDQEHQHAAGRIVARACGEDLERWRQATEASRRALSARIALWDQIHASLALQHEGAA